MRRLLAPICLIVGHDWAPPVPSRIYEAYPHANIWRTVCHRCTKTICGDWDWMEDNHAWTHYTKGNF